MKAKVWFKYFIYGALIILVQYLMPTSDFYGDSEFINFANKNGILLYMIYIIIGGLLGLEHFISELGRKGKWMVNLPKLLLMGIPTLYLCTSYYLMVYAKMPLNKYPIIIYPAYEFLRSSDIFITVFLVILGYTIATSFYKDYGKGKNRIIMEWLKYLVCSILIITMQYLGVLLFSRNYFVCALEFSGSLNGKLVEFHEPNIEMLFFYVSLGIIIGIEYLLDMSRKNLIVKINLPRILTLGLASLYFSLYSVLAYIDNNFIKNTVAYPLINLWQRVCILYVPVFQMILGFVIITSFYRYKEAAIPPA